jgi:phage major head subunit gpT-like protein
MKIQTDTPMKVEKIKSDFKIELSSNTNNFINAKGMITLNSELSNEYGKLYQQALIDEKITDQKIFSMKIHIHATVNGEIMLGVVDRKKQKNKLSSYDSGYAISFSGNSGRIFEGKGNDRFGII